MPTITTDRPLFSRAFDDLVVGAQTTTRGRTLTTADVAAFSGLTWDHHPVHTDEVAAVDGVFGGIVAHGMLVLSCAIGLLPVDGERLLALRRLRDVAFKAPVRPGDTIRVHVTVAELAPLDDAVGRVRVRLRVLAHTPPTDDRVAIVATIDTLWARTIS